MMFSWLKNPWFDNLPMFSFVINKLEWRRRELRREEGSVTLHWTEPFWVVFWKQENQNSLHWTCSVRKKEERRTHTPPFSPQGGLDFIKEPLKLLDHWLGPGLNSWRLLLETIGTPEWIVIRKRRRYEWTDTGIFVAEIGSSQLAPLMRNNHNWNLTLW